MGEVGVCPLCWKTDVRVSNRRLLAHSVPRELYKDRRGCRAAGRIAADHQRKPADG